MHARECAGVVLIYLDCSRQADQDDRAREVSTLEEQLAQAIERDLVVECQQLTASIARDGRAWLQVCGSNAERLFSGIEATLRASPLCKGARVIVRNGGPGSQQREVLL